MDREIKFRGKRVDNGEWIYGYYTVIKGTHYISEDIPDGIYFDHSVIPESVGQFTGLTDKNGKEIYNRDVYLSFGGIVNVVSYHNGAFGYWVYPNTDYSYFVSFAGNTNFNIIDGKSDKIEIIGNLTDNPELLKQ